MIGIKEEKKVVSCVYAHVNDDVPLLLMGNRHVTNA